MHPPPPMKRCQTDECCIHSGGGAGQESSKGKGDCKIPLPSHKPPNPQWVFSDLHWQVCQRKSKERNRAGRLLPEGIRSTAGHPQWILLVLRPPDPHHASLPCPILLPFCLCSLLLPPPPISPDILSPSACSVSLAGRDGKMQAGRSVLTHTLLERLVRQALAALWQSVLLREPHRHWAVKEGLIR